MARRLRRAATSLSAMSFAAPVSTIAVDSEIIPPTRMTVVQEIPRYACSTERTPESTRAHGCEQAGHRGGHGAGREEHDHHSEHADRALRSGAERHGLPSNERRACRRRARPGSSRFSLERVPRALEEDRVADGEARAHPARSSPLPLDGENDEIAAVGDHPGEDGLADQRRSAEESRPRPTPERRREERVRRRPRSRTGRRACERDRRSRAASPGRCDAEGVARRRGRRSRSSRRGAGRRRARTRRSRTRRRRRSRLPPRRSR